MKQRKQRSRQRFLALVMVVMFALSNVTPMVTPAMADPIKAGLIKIDRILNMGTGGGTGGGASSDDAGTTSDNAKTIYFGSYWQSYNGDISTATDEQKADIANYKKEGVKWRVLSTGNGKVLLLADKVLYADAFNNSTASGHTWGTSEVRSTLNGLDTVSDSTRTASTDGSSSPDAYSGLDEKDGFAKDAFSAAEYGAIVLTSNDSTTTQDKLFLLSQEEAKKSGYGFSTTDAKHNSRVASATVLAKNVQMYDNGATAYEYSGSFWWLRSPGSKDIKAFGVGIDGKVYETNVLYGDAAVRPAFNLNPESVLFLTAANTTQGKSATTIGAFSIDNTYTGSDGWKVTLKDTSITAPTVTSVTQTKTDGVDDLAAEGATTLDLTNGLAVGYTGDPNITYDATASFSKGANYLSAVVKDSSGNYVNYARIVNSMAKSGTWSVGTSNLAEGAYTMYIFAETANGDKETD